MGNKRDKITKERANKLVVCSFFVNNEEIKILPNSIYTLKYIYVKIV